MKNLLTGNTHRDKHFRDRAYNSSLAFASLCLTGQEFKFKNAGPYCYRVNGQLYHVLSQMQPEHGQEPTFHRYIYMTVSMSWISYETLYRPRCITSTGTAADDKKCKSICT